MDNLIKKKFKEKLFDVMDYKKKILNLAIQFFFKEKLLNKRIYIKIS